MNRLISSLITLLVSICPLFAGPVIKWVETTHNFGAFDENDGKVTCSFKFVNNGDRNLIITSARATCGCATPSFTQKPIAPGDSGSVEVTYNPIGRPGRFDKKVFIETNAIPSRSTLIIKGVVIGASNTVRSKFPIDAGPLKLRNKVIAFGEVLKSRTKTVFLDVYNTTGDSIVPQWIDVPNYITITPGTPSIPAGDYGSFAFNIAPERTPLYGIVDDSLKIAVGNSEPVKLSVVAILNEDFSFLSDKQLEKAPDIKVTPEKVDFDIIYPKDTKLTKEIEIKNTGKDPLILRRIFTPDKALTLDINNRKIKGGKSARLKITLNAETAPNITNSVISIISNSPDNPTINVRVTGLKTK